MVTIRPQIKSMTLTADIKGKSFVFNAAVQPFLLTPYDSVTDEVRLSKYLSIAKGLVFN